MTNYIGIDYGLGNTNVDANGFRYGVISQHSISDFALDDMEVLFAGPNCPKCGNDAVEIPTHTETSNPPGQWVFVIQDIPEAYEDFEQSRGCSDYACKSCRYLFDSSEAFSEESIGMKLEDDEYAIESCLDTDLIITRSPYYTYAQFCSPCVPGACNLENPLSLPITEPDTAIKQFAERQGYPRCYALGHDWFEDGKAPYRVFRVSDDTEVLPEVRP